MSKFLDSAPSFGRGSVDENRRVDDLLLNIGAWFEPLLADAFGFASRIYTVVLSGSDDDRNQSSIHSDPWTHLRGGYQLENGWLDQWWRNWAGQDGGHNGEGFEEPDSCWSMEHMNLAGEEAN